LELIRTEIAVPPSMRARDDFRELLTGKMKDGDDHGP
jgi:hypothetical protein